MKQLIFIVILTLSLQGCFMIIGGAAIGAATAAILYDSRSPKKIMADEDISRQILLVLNQNEQIKQQTHLVVSTYHGIVLIAGQAPTEELKQSIEKAIKTVPDIKRLYNAITIEGPTSILTRTSDAWITAKIKTKLMNTSQLKSGQFKVVTENGIVYLMGIVSQSQEQLAINEAKTVDGVQKVVTVFSRSPKPI